MKVRVTLNVNGESREALVPTHKTLLEVLREDLGLTGTKHGCELGECGTCTVLVDGEPVLSCLALPVETEGRRITTVEGMAEGGRAASAPASLRRAGRRAVRILHARHPAHGRRRSSPSGPARHGKRSRRRWPGNLCRCTGYTKILDAVELAALRMGRQEARTMTKNEFAVIGRPLPKVDAWAKVVGETKYADDLVPAAHGVRQAPPQRPRPRPHPVHRHQRVPALCRACSRSSRPRTCRG